MLFGVGCGQHFVSSFLIQNADRKRSVLIQKRRDDVLKYEPTANTLLEFIMAQMNIVSTIHLFSL